MSLLSELAVNLRAAGTELPLPEVRRAAHEVDTASRRLAAALIQQPPGIRALSGALEHLDSAAGALLLAQHSLQGYLASVGALPPPVPSTVDTPIPSNWWVERVVELTGHRPGLPLDLPPGVRVGDRVPFLARDQAAPPGQDQPTR